MSDFAAYIFHVNREDLLQRAVQSVQEFGWNLMILDNSQTGLSYTPSGQVQKPCVPLTFSQSMNFALTRARSSGAKICVFMHSDAVAAPGSCLKLVECARRLNMEGRKWGALFTNYDALAALNVGLLDDVGLWDTNLPQYFSDNDYYRRVRLAGYECIETALEVTHEPSQTIKSDPTLNFINGITFPLYESYYQRKWGGKPGKERFTTPFNRL